MQRYLVTSIPNTLSEPSPSGAGGGCSGQNISGEKLIICEADLLTLAGLNIELVAPCSVLQAVDHSLIEPCGRICPVFSWAVVFYCRCIWPRVHSLHSRPIVHSKVIVLHGKGWQCAVDGWKENESENADRLRMQVGMTWPPWSGIGFQTASSQHSTCVQLTQTVQQSTSQPQTTPAPLGLDLAAHCDALPGSLLQNRLGRCR